MTSSTSVAASCTSTATNKGFDHAANVTKLLAQGGLERRAVTSEEMRSIEPTLAGQYYGGFYTESDSTGDIHLFTHGLAQACERLGVRFLRGTQVLHAQADGRIQHPAAARRRRRRRSRRNSTPWWCARASGAADLAAQLGDRLNIYPVKGYSITVHLQDDESQSAAPWVSLLDDETKLVTSRLGADRFRVAGTAEFNGINQNIRADRIRPLTQLGQPVLPRCIHPPRRALGRPAPPCCPP